MAIKNQDWRLSLALRARCRDLSKIGAKVPCSGETLSLFSRNLFPVLAKLFPVLRIRNPCIQAGSGGLPSPSFTVRIATELRRRHAGGASVPSRRATSKFVTPAEFCAVCSPSERGPMTAAFRLSPAARVTAREFAAVLALIRTSGRFYRRRRGFVLVCGDLWRNCRHVK